MTAFIANLALMRLSADIRLLPAIAILSAVLVLVGLAMRWRGGRQLAASFTVLGVFLAALIASVWWATEALPGDFSARLQALFVSALNHMETNPAPLEAHDGVLIILVAIAALVAWLTDVFYVAGRLVVPALGVLAVPYFVVAFVPRVHNHPAMMVALLVTMMGLTAAATRQQSTQWTNLVRTDQTQGHRFGYRSSAVATSLAWLTVPAVVLALLAGLLLPVDGTPRVDVGELRRTPIQLTDPTIRLNENLHQPEDVPLLSYRTNQPGGVYLRNTALVNVNNRGWTLSDMKLQRGTTESVPGLPYAVPAVQTTVQIGDFDFSYLPAPYAPLNWDAPGRWSFDPNTLTVIDTRRGAGSTTIGLTYTVTSTDLGPSFDQVRSAHAGTPPDAHLTSHVPADIPPQIIELTNTLTAAASTDGEKALALQDYFREPGRFSYSLAAPAGVGFGTLTNFLFEQRSGYCIHFASAMALMARVAGIASRVAVGFTPGELQADGSYVVSAHDMHAWPELFFEGLGWVRFEPTAPVWDAPAYTSAEPSPTPTPLPVEPVPTLEPTFENSPQPSDQPSNSPGEDQPVGSGKAGLGWLLVIVLLGLLLATPWFVRSRVRAGRLSRSGPDGVHGIWSELAASYLDYGRTWPGGSPRAVGAELAANLDHATAEAIQRLALAQERALFSDLSDWSDDLGQLRADLDSVTDRLAEDATSGRRIVAKIWPVSLFSAQLRSNNRPARSA